MPNLRVPEEDVQLLVAYLSALHGDQTVIAGDAPAADTELIKKGKILARDKGCTGCHKIDTFPLGFNAPEHNGIGTKRVDELVFADTDIPHTLSGWLKKKVKNPRAFNTVEIPTLMPKFGFNDDEAEALLTMLLSIRRHDAPPKYVSVLADPQSVSVKGDRIVEQNNCRGCHKIGGRGGTIGPNLSFEGDRVNPEWLAGFVQKPTKIRPIGIEPTRMPTFGFGKIEGTALAAYFVGLNKAEYPYYLPEKKIMSKEDTDQAWKFFFQSFSCQACHSWNGQGGIVGPDQSDLGNRLRREWIAKWLQNPQKFIADVRMPNFELYPDEAEKLTNLLMTFTDISPSIWAQIKKRWEDEQLAKQAQQMEGN
jgi:cytochrome c551/c552